MLKAEFEFASSGQRDSSIKGRFYEVKLWFPFTCLHVDVKAVLTLTNCFGTPAEM